MFISLMQLSGCEHEGQSILVWEPPGLKVCPSPSFQVKRRQMFGKICIHGGKLQLLLCALARSRQRRQVIGPKVALWTEDPFFLGWIRTKEREEGEEKKKNQYLGVAVRGEDGEGGGGGS